MSRNKFMHPRNKYKNPPDYTELAIKYQEFRNICKLELNGKVSINLKKDGTLEALTKTLLLNDFQLNVDIPKNSLIPTIPLRLNYILWIEDLMQLLNLEDHCPKGIDIGCGAVCVYGLLCAKMFSWEMHCLETQEQWITSAQQNIDKNKLNQLIKIHHQPNNEKIFNGTSIFQNNFNYEFTMCNPPFHSNHENVFRKPKLPNNQPTGNEIELITDGGEIKFITQIIEESIEFQSRVRIFTSMIGCKKNLKDILQILKTKNIENYSETEFCQGNITRWGIAWSFENKNKLDLNKCVKYY